MSAVATFIRWISRRALRWFYREVRYVGRKHVPKAGAVLLIGNHPNDLPDVLAGFFTTERPVRYIATISATTMPFAESTYRGLGVIPVMRVRDVRKMRARGMDVAAVNTAAFSAVQQAFRRGDVVGVFPEGGVHDTPRVGILRVGVSKMALDYINDGANRDLEIVPFGLQYEGGQIARSDVLVNIGRPISLRDWVTAERTAGRTATGASLTSMLHEALLGVTRNSHSWHDASVRDRLVAAMASLHRGPGAPIERAARCQAQCSALIERAPETGETGHAVLWRTIADPVSDAVRRAGGVETSARDTARVLAAAEVADVEADWPSSGWLTASALPAIVGLALHAPIWAVVRWTARQQMEVRTDYAAKAILPGLHLILLGYALLTTAGAVILRVAGTSPWWALALLVLLPRLGDLALSWRDGMCALRLRARVRAWSAADRSALDSAVQRLRRAWSTVS